MKTVAGRPLGLECVARGYPPPTLSWYHEGLPLAESNGTGTWLEAGGGLLSLDSLGEASGGLYSCVASSPAGEAVLQYAVDVQGEPDLSRPSHRAAGPSSHTYHVPVPAAPPGSCLWSMGVYLEIPEAQSGVVGSGPGDRREGPSPGQTSLGLIQGWPVGLEMRREQGRRDS